MQLTFLLLLLLVLIPSITTLKCFVCNSNEDAKCQNDGGLGKFTQECPQVDQPYCRKIVQTINKETSIVRSCGSKIGAKACYKTAGANSANVCSCDTNLCNNAPSFNRHQQIMMSFSSIIIMGITMIVIR